MDNEIKPFGRPSVYSIALIDDICTVISMTDKGIQRLCEENQHWPTFQTINNWLLGVVKSIDNTYFLEQYARAKALQADYMAQKYLEVSTQPNYDDVTYTDSQGNESTTRADNVNRSRVAGDAYKWHASKLNAKKYGEKIDLTSGGKELKPFDVAAALGAFMGSATPINTIDITAQELEQERLEQPKKDTDEA